VTGAASPLRIGLNAMFWIPDAMGGTQTYFLRLLEALVRVAPHHEYVVFVNAEAAGHVPARSQVRVEVCPVPGTLRPARLLWEQWDVPRRASRLRLDLVHSLGYLAPAGLRVPSVVTVLDMIHYIHPEQIEPMKLALWRVLFPLSLRRARRILAISESVKRDIVRFFPSAGPKVTSIPLGVDPELFSPGELGPRTADEPPFVLAVASAAPHKNVDGLLRAFALATHGMPELRLRLVGMRTPTTESLGRLAEALGVGDRVEFTGRVEDAALAELYRRAAVMVFPSRYEGFGLPALEAMACGCPVIASNRASVPEVVGDAAVQVDPDDVEAMAAALRRVLGSAALRDDLRCRGLARAAGMRWDLTAERTLAVYQAAVAG
jgi:glycosyltransferase involved in cell wall biosynthesis